MCGYVSTGLRNAVTAARSERSAQAAQDAGRFYGVASVTKAGKIRPFDTHRNLPLDRAQEAVAYVARLNPKSTIVLIDCRTNAAV